MPNEIVAELVESRYITAELQERPSQGVQALIDKIYLYNPDAANKLIEELNEFIEKLEDYRSYNSLSDKPILDTTSDEELEAVADETIQGTIKLHKVSKTGSYADLLSKPQFGELAFKNTIYNSDVADGAGITKNKLSSEVQATLDKADASVGAIEAEAQARQEADEQLQTNIEAEATARENEDTKLKAQIDANAAAIQKTREDYAAADEALQEQINSSAGDISTLRTDLDDLGEQVSVIESKIPESASDTNQLVTSNQLTDESQDIRSEFAQADSELQQQINAHTTAITGLENDVEAIESKIPTTASQENLLATTSQLNDAIQGVRTDFASADTELQTQITAQAAAITTLQTDLGDLGDQVVDNHNDISNHIANTSNPHSITKSQVGLGNVDNTSDLNKPISDATQAALDKLDEDYKAADSTINSSIATINETLETVGDTLDGHIANKSNPHSVTKAQVGLGNVDNTSDMNKPVSTAMQEALDLKANQSTTYTKTESDENLTNALTDYVKFTDYATSSTAGVAIINPSYGIVMGTSTHNIVGYPVTLAKYLDTSDRLIICKGTLENIQDDYVKRGITENDITLTDTEKESARTWIGAGSQEDVTSIEGDVSTIESKIPSTASSTNLLADRAFVNSSINNLAAFYLTSNVAGDAFATKAALVAGPYYFQGELRTATLNDYAIVIADETKDNASTRYMYDGTQWDFQYVINDTPFTQDQLNAINSTITQEKVESYSAHIINESNPHSVTKAQVGLGNVDNTSDADKPVSTATQGAIDEVSGDLTDHIENTENPHGVTKAQVGLGNADNTSDLNKPISTATQAALDLKANSASVYTKAQTYSQTEIDDKLEAKLDVSAASSTYATIASLNSHVDNKSNPHSVTKAQVGLGNVDNTSDANKPVSTAQQNAINTAKQDVIDQYMEADTALQTQINGQATAIAGNTDDITEINSKISSSASSTNKLISASELTAESQDIRSDYMEADSDLQTQINGLSSAVTTNQSNISGLRTDVDDLENQVTSNHNDITAHIADTSNPHNVTKTQVGLGNVDNTSDANKPVSTAQQTALNLKADKSTTYSKTEVDDLLEPKLDSETAEDTYATITNLNAHTSNTSNPHSVTKSQVGLGNVDNTSDLSKPISTATQTALNAKADQSNTYTKQETDDLLDDKADKSTTYTKTQVDTSLGTKVDKVSTANKVYGTNASGAQTTYDVNSFGAVDDVQVDGISVVSDKIASLGSMAGEDASDYSTKAVADTLYAAKSLETTVSSHINNTSNPHSVTKVQVGLGNVDNTSDLSKPVSTAQQTAINTAKQDVISGYTTADGELQQQINGQATAISTNTSNITALTTRVGTNETNIALLDSDVDTINTELATAKTDITNLKSSVNSQAGLIQGLQDDVSGKVDKNQGTTNAGKILSVGSDGQVTLTEAPGGGLTAVAHDSTLTGTGTNESPLGIASTVLAEIADKAEQTTVETLSGAVSQNTTNIGTLRTDVDDLGDQVSGIESKIPASASSTNQLATKSEIPTVPTNISAFNNDSGYITSSALTPYATTQALNDGLATKQPAGDYATNSALTSGLALKVAIAQGAENAGKILKIDASGNVIVADETGGSASFPILYHTWSDHLMNEVSWLRADTFSWQSGDVYVAAYNHLLSDVESHTGELFYAWKSSLYGYYIYTTTTTPDSTTVFYDEEFQVDTEHSFDSFSGGVLYLDNPPEKELSFRRDPSKDTNAPITDTVDGVSITYYLAEDGHKICLPDQEDNILALYNAIGVAWYYILDVDNKQFKLPRINPDLEELAYQISAFGDGDYLRFMSSNDSSKGSYINSHYENLGSGTGWMRTYNSGGGLVDLGDMKLSDVKGQSGIKVEKDTIFSGKKYLYFYVGNFEQSAIEQTAGLNAELFNQKMDNGTPLARDIFSPEEWENESMEQILSVGAGSGTLTFSKNWQEYDYLWFSSVSDASNTLDDSPHWVNVKWMLEQAKAGVTNLAVVRYASGGYWYVNPQTWTETTMPVGSASEGLYINRVYAIKLKNITAQNVGLLNYKGLFETAAALVATVPTAMGQWAIVSNDETQVGLQTKYFSTKDVNGNFVWAFGGVIDSSLVGADYVVESQMPTAANNYTWYRKYKSGWVEQGGQVPANANGSYNVTMPVEMANTNYGYSCSAYKNSTDNGFIVICVLKTSITTTGFTVCPRYAINGSTGAPGEGGWWQVSGMSA